MKVKKQDMNPFTFLVFFIIPLILIVFSPAVSSADADRIFKENNKAVVVIVTFDEKGKPISQGSGFIVRADGAIVTNYHVISNAKDIKVKAGEKILDVEGLIYEDKENDLVILKAQGEKLPVVRIGDIEKTNIGEKVYVISSPEGLENTISDGLLSGIRKIGEKKKMLQITASISPGSSGGPVFNKEGEVIGIATLLIKEAQNLNFAMPVNLIKDKITAEKVITLKSADITDYKKTAEYWLVLGYYYGEAGLHKDAIESLKQAISIEPDYAEAHYGLGLTYGSLKMYKEAIESLKQAIRIKPDYADAHGSLGFTYGSLKMYKEAIESLKQAIRIKPDNEEDHFYLGRVYGSLKMYEEAVESLKQAIRIKPDYADAHFSLGFVYASLGMYKEAIEAYKQAIRIKPDDAKAHFYLGDVYASLKMYKEGKESFKQAIRIKPDYADAHCGLGFMYVLLGDRNSALEEYKILKNLDTESAKILFDSIYK